MKGLVFAGCSYTWGQGLYYYSNLNHIPKFEDWVYDYSLMTHSSIRYKDTIRFARLVANHFNTFEVCKASNGGSDLTSVNFLKKIFDVYEEPVNDGGYTRMCDWLSTENYYFDDIEYIIFQTTQPYRSRLPFTYKGENYFIYPKPEMAGVHNVSKIYPDGVENPVENGIDTVFYYFLEENNYTMDDYLKKHIEYWTDEIKNILTHYENKGIKIKILNWTNEYDDEMKKHEFFKNKIINLIHNGIRYKCISDLQRSSKNLTIAEDVEGFNGNKPEESLSDFHPSKLCHEIISKNIIREIEKDMGKHQEEESIIDFQPPKLFDEIITENVIKKKPLI